MNAPQLGVQLYTLREECASDFMAVVERVADMGYLGVELFGLNDLRPHDVRHALEHAELQIASALVGLEPADRFASDLDTYAELGVDTVVVVALPPENFTSVDALGRASDRLNEASEQAQARSLALGYHNHWWEIEATIDGRPALLALFDRLEPNVIAEVDIYWPQVAGVDPAGLVRELGRRVQLLHVKDGPVDPAVPMVAVGDGALDIPAVLAAATYARWHLVELDECATSMEEAVARSHDYLVEHGLSIGRSAR